MKSLCKDGLINRALMNANGGNIHDVRVLAAYYRNACDTRFKILRKSSRPAEWTNARLKQQLKDIQKYEKWLQHFADTGTVLREAC